MHDNPGKGYSRFAVINVPSPVYLPRSESIANNGASSLQLCLSYLLLLMFAFAQLQPNRFVRDLTVSLLQVLLWSSILIQLGYNSPNAKQKPFEKS
jgi:hypothetical protein